MAKILIIASDGFEQSELFVPLEKLKASGHDVHLAAPEKGDIRGWDKTDWGKSVAADLTIADASEGDYDALVLPGGQINPDVLRLNDDAVALIRKFGNAGKPVAAICHAPWLLIEAGLAKGRKLTSFPSIRTDIANAGAEVLDESVVVDGNIITSRNPDDLDDFVGAIEKAVA
ncbi:type 1 glutamine amidotransferase domain-containing protein [Paracoccus sp. 1_MG-2023]|uniref:type 1 glutamine amidotransferase domain-containing protein n=1 Tax=unclassified Paracoccus (in: a-proteobacteria) TaxID=2688777 RepID=UPI001C096FE5|nr:MULTISPECIES: type 1 glutamine amidotransferase domain-containing protein [unclassified Paracoccus (in: a-proteobacteria)]MBU2957568.1 type 1 glutamine amidotransferase [Paracoccus sp. C2R09]MDO6669772.1 type 1 glutamine amidotransferase domain-containing protein [Paracoccus sp. 1_MG-2023]